MCHIADEHAIFLLERAIEQQSREGLLRHLRDALSEIVGDKESEYELLEKEEINSIVDNIQNNAIPASEWKATR